MSVMHLFIRMGFQSIRKENTFLRNPILLGFLGYLLLPNLFRDSAEFRFIGVWVRWFSIWNRIRIREFVL